MATDEEADAKIKAIDDLSETIHRQLEQLEQARRKDREELKGSLASKDSQLREMVSQMHQRQEIMTSLLENALAEFRRMPRPSAGPEDQRFAPPQGMGHA